MKEIRGCWLGQLAGDALGSMVEFQSEKTLRDLFPEGLRIIEGSRQWGTVAGQPTDDSELAISLARVLVKYGFDEERIAYAYLEWIESHPFDIGSTIGLACNAIGDAWKNGASMVAEARNRANRQSQANGALMRQSPLAVWTMHRSIDDIARFAEMDTSLTHPNAVCVEASQVHLIGMVAALNGDTAEDAFMQALAWHVKHGNEPTILNALLNANEDMPQCDLQNRGQCTVALQAAWFQALHAPSFEEGVVQTVMAGGDTDTNGAIAGALLGALYGEDAVPDQWRLAIETCAPDKSTSQPRPTMFWPDVELIEKVYRV